MMINEFVIPPAIILIIGAFVLPLLRKKIRSFAFLFFAFITLFYIWNLPDGAIRIAHIMDYSLILCKVDALSRIFGLVFSFILFAGGIYAFHIKETGQQSAALLYAAGAIGVIFAGDLFTLFIFWESMGFTSLYLIWARRTKESRESGFRYLIYHVFGGGMLFIGILMHISETGNIMITRLFSGGSISSWFILLGVAINAAIPPLHTWLSDAYPKATITGAVFLSALTTKSAVYVLIRMFPGWDILVVLGVIMSIHGVVFAVLSNNIRGILSYHIMSQVGYMVAGVGIGSAMALNGATALAISNVLYKATLFMGTGIVLYTTGKDKLNELGGLVKSQRLTMCLYMIAALAISGAPLLNGFVSKSLVIGSAGEANHNIAMLLLHLASVGTFLSVGLKLPYFTWFSKPKDKNLVAKAPPKNMYIAMVIVNLLCILYGIMPSLLYNLLPFPVHFKPYNMHHLVETIQILTFTFIAFWLLRKKLKPHKGIFLDFDWFYRRPAKLAKRIFVDSVAVVFDKADKAVEYVTKKSVEFGRNPYIIFGKFNSEKTYTPDKYRPPIRLLLLSILAAFIFIYIIGLF